MTFIVHYTLPDGTEDSVIVSGETVEEVRAKAVNEVEKRGGLDPWSEESKP